MILEAKHLSPDQKAVIEGLLGRRVLENEAISLRAISPPPLSSEQRQELAAELENYFAVVDAQRQAGSRDEAEQILNEAMKSVPSGLPLALAKIVDTLILRAGLSDLFRQRRREISDSSVRWKKEEPSHGHTGCEEHGGAISRGGGDRENLVWL